MGVIITALTEGASVVGDTVGVNEMVGWKVVGDSVGVNEIDGLAVVGDSVGVNEMVGLSVVGDSVGVNEMVGWKVVGFNVGCAVTKVGCVDKTEVGGDGLTDGAKVGSSLAKVSPDAKSAMMIICTARHTIFYIVPENMKMAGHESEQIEEYLLHGIK